MRFSPRILMLCGALMAPVALAGCGGGGGGGSIQVPTNPLLPAGEVAIFDFFNAVGTNANTTQFRGAPRADRIEAQLTVQPVTGFNVLFLFTENAAANRRFTVELSDRSGPASISRPFPTGFFNVGDYNDRGDDYVFYKEEPGSTPNRNVDRSWISSNGVVEVVSITQPQGNRAGSVVVRVPNIGMTPFFDQGTQFDQSQGTFTVDGAIALPLRERRNVSGVTAPTVPGELPENIG